MELRGSVCNSSECQNVRMELLEGLVRRAGNTGDGEMVVVGDDRMSADALLSLADATAARIRGARAIAVCATPSMSTVVGIVSALRAGAAIVPVASDSGPAERDHILGDSGAVAILGDHVWGETSLPVIPLGGDGSSLASGESGDLNDAALIMYTSGTTGAPKGVLMPTSPIAACLDGI